tara:strand:- start:10940 stop:11299 length:360 start_codon:yes stop_codon:yes gene_type:complete
MKKILHILISVMIVSGGVLSSADAHSIDELSNTQNLSVSVHHDVDTVPNNGEDSSKDNYGGNHEATHCGHGCAHSHMLGQVTVHSFLSISGIGKRYLLGRDVLITDVVFGLKRPPRIFA